jgi:uncharacterized protein YaiI (UPF0178 family)
MNSYKSIQKSYPKICICFIVVFFASSVSIAIDNPLAALAVKAKSERVSDLQDQAISAGARAAIASLNASKKAISVTGEVVDDNIMDWAQTHMKTNKATKAANTTKGSIIDGVKAGTLAAVTGGGAAAAAVTAAGARVAVEGAAYTRGNISYQYVKSQLKNTVREQLKQAYAKNGKAMPNPIELEKEVTEKYRRKYSTRENYRGAETRDQRAERFVEDAKKLDIVGAKGSAAVGKLLDQAADKVRREARDKITLKPNQMDFDARILKNQFYQKDESDESLAKRLVKKGIETAPGAARNVASSIRGGFSVANTVQNVAGIATDFGGEIVDYAKESDRSEAFKEHVKTYDTLDEARSEYKQFRKEQTLQGNIDGLKKREVRLKGEAKYLKYASGMQRAIKEGPGDLTDYEQKIANQKIANYNVKKVDVLSELDTIPDKLSAAEGALSKVRTDRIAADQTGTAKLAKSAMMDELLSKRGSESDDVKEARKAQLKRKRLLLKKRRKRERKRKMLRAKLNK